MSFFDGLKYFVFEPTPVPIMQSMEKLLDLSASSMENNDTLESAAIERVTTPLLQKIQYLDFIFSNIWMQIL